VTVVDSSVVIDALIGGESAVDVEEMLQRERTVSAPDLLVFEVLAVLRRDVRRGILAVERAEMAVADLADLAVDLYPTLPLRMRGWELRENLTAGDTLFVALAERLDEPLATKDRALAAAARDLTRIETIELPSS